MAILPIDLVPGGLNFLRNLDGLATVENVQPGAVRDDHPVFANADPAHGRRANFARNFGDGPKRRLVGAVVLRDVERVLLHEIEALAQFEARADGLAVVFGDAEQAVDAVVAFRILHAAGAHERSVHRLRGGKNLEAVNVELAVLIGRAVGVDAQNEIAWNDSERRGELRGVFDIAGGELRTTTPPFWLGVSSIASVSATRSTITWSRSAPASVSP